MSIVNLGSLNIDRVFRVPRIARPGETIAATSLAIFAGGKGANQSVALARAGADATHVGRVGNDGQWLIEKLAAEGIDTRAIQRSTGPTGQAIIQVDDAGENAIMLWPAANHEITPDDVDRALDRAAAGSWLLVQNETSSVEHAMLAARNRGLRVAFNPAPFDDRVREYPLASAHLICVNETEGMALAGEASPGGVTATLADRLPDCEILLTLGAGGATYRHAKVEFHEDAPARRCPRHNGCGRHVLGLLSGRMRGRAGRPTLPAARLPGGGVVRDTTRGDGLDSAEERSRAAGMISAGRWPQNGAQDRPSSRAD